MIRKTLKSFTFALRGIKTVLKEEVNFRVMSAATVLILGATFYFGFTFIESSLIVVAVIVVLVSEMINTAIEDLCNRVEPNTDPVIGKIKDISSGFVLLASIGAAVLGVLVFYNHFA